MTRWAYSTVMTGGIWSTGTVVEVLVVAAAAWTLVVVVGAAAGFFPPEEHPAATTATTITATARSRPTDLTLAISARTVLVPASGQHEMLQQEERVGQWPAMRRLRPASASEVPKSPSMSCTTLPSAPARNRNGSPSRW